MTRFCRGDSWKGRRGWGSAFTLEFDESFDEDRLDESRWLPYYLPHWNTLEQAAARYALRGGQLHLLIEAD